MTRTRHVLPQSENVFEFGGITKPDGARLLREQNQLREQFTLIETLKKHNEFIHGVMMHSASCDSPQEAKVAGVHSFHSFMLYKFPARILNCELEYR